MDYLSVFEQFELVGRWFVLKQFFLPFFGLVAFLTVLSGLTESWSSLLGNVWGWGIREQYRLVGEMVGGVGEGYGKWLFVVYVSVVLWNMVGLLPFSYALTSQLVVTFLLGLGMWLGKLKSGVRIQGLRLLGHFLPIGLPLGLGPFFVLIELVGFLIPLVSISVRLFANILSGHVLVHVLLGFLWGGLTKGLGWLVVVPALFLLLLVALEWGVAFIQGYVFALLVSVYLGEVDD